MNKVIAIDFDGTLCTNAYPEIGEPNWPVIFAAKAEQEKGAKPFKELHPPLPFPLSHNENQTRPPDA